jgi:hypothetical protein
VTNGTLVVRKSIGSGSNIIARKSFIQESAGVVAGHEGKYDPGPQLDKAAEGRDHFVQIGDDQFQADLVLKWYGEQKLGADAAIEATGFSFRDPPQGSAQYKTAQFKLYEPRWQQMVRLGMGSGGTAWTEQAVSCQGQETYPWPGKAKWVDEPTLLQYERHTLYDDGEQCAQDRPGPYDDPKLGTWSPAKPDGTFRTVL